MSGEPIVLARIGKPHGLRGEVTVQLHTDEPERRFAVGTVIETVARPGSGTPRELTVRSTRVHKGTWLIAFEEVPDRTGAERLRGTRLVLDPNRAGAEDGGAEDGRTEDEFYEEDLVGLEVRDRAGEPLGRVTGLEIGAAQDRLVIELLDGVTAYLPFVQTIVPEIAEDHVVVDAPPGLFDLYRNA